MTNPMNEREKKSIEDRDEERLLPRPGERYRHFKNKLYQVVAVASHSETGEQMVVYQALYGDYGVWVRPLAMFMEPVDREKYPDAKQRYRFERVEDACGAAGIPGAGAAGMPGARAAGIPGAGVSEMSGACAAEMPGASASSMTGSPAQDEPNPLLLEFLDNDSSEERLAVLQKMKGKVGQSEIDSLCLCLDIRPTAGSLEEQLDGIRQYLRMQQRYDAPRLRRS